MIYSVLLVFVARLLILCQALPQASADSDEVSSTEKVKDWPAVPDPVIEADYLSFKNPAEESELQNVTAKDTLADRAEIVAVWSRNSRRTDTDGVEIINIDEQMYAFFLEEYKGTELIRRYINHGTVSQWDGDDVSSDMGFYTSEMSITEPLPDGATTKELIESYGRLVESYERLVEQGEDGGFGGPEVGLYFDTDIPVFDCDIVVESAVESAPMTLHGSGWELMIGRKGRYEIEGIWRPRSKEEATISPYQSIVNSAGGGDSE